MRKGTMLHNMKAAIGALTVLLAYASCINDSYVDAPTNDDATVNVGLTLRTSPLTSDSKTFVPGNTYENYIDLTGNDYRIYFFTYDSNNNGNDTFLARFEPLDVVANYGSDYTEYTMYGTVPESVTSKSAFKIMVLANWGAYEDDESLDGASIDDVCTESTATYSAFVGDDGNAVMPSADKRIPFYGIHAYSDITFKKGEAVMLLDKPITLLRAMAKVEVVLETEDVTFSSVAIQRYNTTGYCAPYKVYSEDNYDHGYNWDTDFLQDVHLVGDANDHDEDGKPIERSIPFNQVQEADADNGIYETWVAYLPEYDNTTSDNDYSYIAVTVEGSDDVHEIYFANYTDGETDNTDTENRFDIQRNNLYRYVVEVSATSVNAVIYVIYWKLLDEEKIDF